MPKAIELLVLMFIFNAGSTLYASYYDTLPKGVRTLVFRHVETSNINSSYNNKETTTPYNYNFEINAKMLKEVQGFSVVADELKSLDPSAYENFLIGKYEINANAKIEVEAFGMGWGLTNKLTVYGVLPFYKANVAISYQRIAKNNFNELGDKLQEKYNCVSCQAAAQLINQLPDVGAAELQHVMTEEFGYKEIGSWEGSDIGDFELGFIYNLNKSTDWGTAITTGFVVPTGRVDDPDLLQDIGFGDGQWDLFAEFGGGYLLTSEWQINSFFRYTYQLPTEKNLRVPYSEEFTLSSNSQPFNEKLGNLFTYHIDSEHAFNDWISLIGAYEYHAKGLNQYDSPFSEANDILASNTNYIKHNMRINLEFSSVKLFQNNSFLLPGKITLGYQNTFSGTNTPKLKQYEIEFRMFF